jgi:hypothetical protein
LQSPIQTNQLFVFFQGQFPELWKNSFSTLLLRVDVGIAAWLEQEWIRFPMAPVSRAIENWKVAEGRFCSPGDHLSTFNNYWDASVFHPLPDHVWQAKLIKATNKHRPWRVPFVKPGRGNHNF